ncbi:hypothetical protein BC938DRAFT_473378 [Jimgerdemannia flammicorona]|uniref:Ion transport domain-containing protein n=1 Tax=Jimgerdemannia flammicorona TaxID=994334 RepID=A0A433Q4A8_9FUNG|nr:hypothetical protein BC938DRAFT_473378 [Jimgerdemannia flammicorona]
MLDDTEEGWSFNDPTKQKGQANAVQRFVKLMKPFWVLTVFADLAVMGLKRNDMSDETLAELGMLERACNYNMDFGELLFTMAFAFEIIVRFSSFYPFWGNFFNERINSVDLALAVITCLIRIPPIHDSSVYPYLTAFQVIRGYRIIMAIPRLKAQMVRELFLACKLSVNWQTVVRPGGFADPQSKNYFAHFLYDLAFASAGMEFSRACSVRCLVWSILCSLLSW